MRRVYYRLERGGGREREEGRERDGPSGSDGAGWAEQERTRIIIHTR